MSVWIIPGILLAGTLTFLTLRAMGAWRSRKPCDGEGE